MWATLAVLTTLSITPTQQGPLQLTHDRMTYGFLGPERQNKKVLAGDVVYLTFDIENLKADAAGKFYYSMSLELIDKDGKKPFSNDPQVLEGVLTLGGNRTPGFAHVEVGADTPAGEYTMKVTVTDRMTNHSKTLSRAFEVVRSEFGFVRIALFSSTGSPAPPLQVVGETPILNVGVTGFQRDNKTKQPNVAVVMNILDENSKPVLAKPLSWEITSDSHNLPIIEPKSPIFGLALNRPGNFTIQLEATDRISNKKANMSLPLRVQDRN